MNVRLRAATWIILMPVMLLLLAVLLVSPTLEWLEHSTHRVPELDELVFGLVLISGLALSFRRVITQLLRRGIGSTQAGVLVCSFSHTVEPDFGQSPPGPPLIGT